MVINYLSRHHGGCISLKGREETAWGNAPGKGDPSDGTLKVCKDSPSPSGWNGGDGFPGALPQAVFFLPFRQT